MWQLTRLSATNICAFEHLDYSPIQHQATLIFGNNLDNESQNSNGSGKSALIEALAIGVTGEPLRKVNVDEIINDRFDEATVSITLINNEANKQLTVNRKLSRKSPQDIQILMQYGPTSDEEEEIKQATVSDYNRYVLEQIGLSKDEILRNFILTARKYQSFLSSSDKEKKEIINRFSNGVMVDESIEALHTDMEPLQQKLLEAEKKVAECNGRVSALADEIERNINESADRKANRKARIDGIKNTISEKRGSIRSLNNEQESINNQLGDLDVLDEEMQTLEESDVDTTAAYKTIKSEFDKLKLPAISDCTSKIADNKVKLQNIEKKLKDLNKQSKTSSDNVDSLVKSVEKIEKSNKTEFDKIDKKHAKLAEEITKLQAQAQQLKIDSQKLTEQRSSLNASIASLEKQLAGVIQCPKCNHEFTLADDVDIDKSRNELAEYNAKLSNIEKSISKSETDYDNCMADDKSKRDEQSKLYGLKLPLQKQHSEAKAKLEEAKANQTTLASNIESVQAQLKSLQDVTANMRKTMFDEVFEAIDLAITKGEKRLSDIDNEIAMANASIKTYEEQIAELENATDGDVLANLKLSKAKYEKDLSKAETDKEAVEAELNQLKLQESTFVEFKTYLANAKINAISQITNDFLEAIGSDIRVCLSGYTILKSGKVRDKISVSLIRDGVDCGSFDKFSAGEKCRVELASVLALHKLSNVNCEDGKGLNLLVIDEILDCTDEAGLANVFKALNDTQVTALVVSHGNIAENYPNRLVVTKQNGVSKINEKPE